MLIGDKLVLDDFETIDPELYRSWNWVLNDMELTEDDGYYFVANDDKGQAVDLIEGGSEIAVTEANKKRFINLWCAWKVARFSDKIKAFQNGFYDLIPREAISSFQPAELDLLLFGLPEFDLEDWRKSTVGSGGPATLHENFWKVVAQMSHEDRSLLLAFWTGCAGVPVGGFKSLKSLSGPNGLQLTVFNFESNCRLPTASTCFNLLKLPNYSSFEQLRDNLFVAIRYGSSGFAFS
jgi:hypothetical protein